MGLQDLQSYIAENCKDALKRGDLIKIARSLALTQAGKNKRGPNQLCLIVDAECCLDRLYGGFYSDWACGGQWNRMNEFLGTFFQACKAAHMEILVFFNGAFENSRINDWFQEQLIRKKHASFVMKHVNGKATPPPKVWWIPPGSLKATLRMALRQYNVHVACSVEDHSQEVIFACRDHNFHGIIAENMEYVVFHPSRYFSSEQLKLTYKGSLETLEYDIDEVSKLLDLHPKRFCILAALLGTHLLGSEELGDFYFRICNVSEAEELKKLKPSDIVKAVLEFVRGLQSVDDLTIVGADVFGTETEKTQKFMQSVHYYMNGTMEHFQKFKKEVRALNKCKPPFPNASPSTPVSNGTVESGVGNEDWDGTMGGKVAAGDTKVDGFLEGDSGYSAGLEKDKLEKTVVEEGTKTPETEVTSNVKALSLEDAEDVANESAETAEGDDKEAKDKAGVDKRRYSERPYKLSQDALKICRDRHAKGLMHPWILQILQSGEIKIDYCLEDENNRDLPLAVDLYRPVRQLVYGILFDLTKRKLAYRIAVKEGKEPIPEKPKAVIREWYVPRGASPTGPKCDEVEGKELDWLVPGLHRLWLGQAMEDKNRRFRAFLSCMFSDSPLMLNVTYVPQQLIVVCAVLRYMIVYSDKRVLRRHELDAFLSTAVSPLLLDSNTMQEMKLPILSTRGIQLGSLFMQGVEHAFFVNEAVGAPVPWGMCSPWNYFDGKLFHYKLLKASNNQSLLDLCDGQVDQVMRVERLRQAILNGLPLDLAFARPPLTPGGMGMPYQGQGPPQMNMRPGGPGPMPPGPFGSNGGRGRGRGGSGPVDSRGGQLQIAGVVVGQWGANTQAQRPAGRGTHISQQNQQVPNMQQPRRGGVNGGPPRVVSSPAARGRYIPRGTSRGGAGGMTGIGRGQNNFQQRNLNQMNMNSMNNRGGPAPGPNRGAMNFRNNQQQQQRPNNRMRQDMGGLGQMDPKSPMENRGRGCTVESHDSGMIQMSPGMLKHDMQYGGGHMSGGGHSGPTHYGSSAGAGSYGMNNPMQQQTQVGMGGHHNSGMLPTQVSMNQNPLAMANMHLASMGMAGGLPHNAMPHGSQLQLGGASLNGGQGDYGQYHHLAANELGAIGMMSEGDYGPFVHRPDYMGRMQMDANMGMFESADE